MILILFVNHLSVLCACKMNFLGVLRKWDEVIGLFGTLKGQSLLVRHDVGDAGIEWFMWRKFELFMWHLL